MCRGDRWSLFFFFIQLISVREEQPHQRTAQTTGNLAKLQNHRTAWTFGQKYADTHVDVTHSRRSKRKSLQSDIFDVFLAELFG